MIITLSMDKRLLKMIASGKIGSGTMMLDTYNQQVHYDIACTIRTNINTANHHFIYMKKRTLLAVMKYMPTQKGRYFVDASFGKARYYSDIAPTITRESEDSGNIGVVEIYEQDNTDNELSDVFGTPHRSQA